MTNNGADHSAKTKIKLNVIFVCTGNTCRSPMAEFLFKQYLKDNKRASDYSVTSAGLYAERGDKLNPTAHATLELLGVKHNAERKAKPFTVQMSLDGDLIVAMTERHVASCDSENAISYAQLIGREIIDPIGGTLQTYLDCAAQLGSGFDALIKIADARLERKREAID